MDGPFEDESRVPFDGPHGGLGLVFDPASFVPGLDPEAWPRATVAVRAQGVRVVGQVSFFASDLTAFVLALESAHTSLRGTLTLESEDGDFSLVVAYGDRGDVTLSGHLRPNLDDPTTLTYEIASDQSYLNASLTALKAIML